MLEAARERLRTLGRGLLAFERREVRAFRRWIETTSNLVHLTILIAVPVLLGLVTAISKTVDLLPFLLFPPLASGSYSLFRNPESRESSPRRFVGGLTAGALCGWLALTAAARLWYGVDPAAYEVSAVAVALGLFMTGAVTWALDIEEASAFSTALLVHVTGTAQFAYVLSVAVSSALVAGAFALWRDYVYEERAQFLYQSTKGDDHVLVPMRGPKRDATAMLAGRLAAAHDAGKVVLLDVVPDTDIAETERAILDGETDPIGLGTDSPADMVARLKADDDPVDPGDVNQNWAEFLVPGPVRDDDVEAGDVSQDWASYDETEIRDLARKRAVAEAATELEQRADRVETIVDVPCEVVVAVGRGSLSKTIGQAAHETNCDLIAVPYETEDSQLATYIRELFRGDTDVLVHRSYDGRTRWKDLLVPVRRADDVAHSMLDFATRLSGDSGVVSACHCVTTERERREAESMLADLVETFDGSLETRVSTATIQQFIESNADQYDLVIMGASRDRSAASRFISPPTFERLDDVRTDVAIVDRNY